MKRCAKYPTDLTEAQWQIIRRLLPRRLRRGRPRTVSRRPAVNAILYVVRTGCQWRMLPNDFPKWPTVYTLFWRWRQQGVWQRIHDALRRLVRKESGKKASPTVGIIDSQSIRTTEVGGEKGYDAGKKTKGRKRHVVVDTLGLILAVVVHRADIQDDSGACLVLQRIAEKFRRLKVVFADSAYKRNGLPDWIKSTLGFLVQAVLRPVGVQGFVVLPKRWIVERTFAWIGRCRRHSKDYERTTQSSEALIQISMIHLMLRRLETAET